MLNGKAEEPRRGVKKFYEKRRRYGTTEFTVFDVELRRNEVFSVVSMLYNL
jgi:hypothetical protein